MILNFHIMYIFHVHRLYLSVKSFERESRFLNLHFLFNRSLESNALKGNIVLQWRKPNARLDINPTLFSSTTSIHQAVRGGSDEGGGLRSERRRGGEEVALNSAKKRRLTFCLRADHGVFLCPSWALCRDTLFLFNGARDPLPFKL